MASTTTTHRYRATESKYKGGANEMYVTYDLEQKTHGGGSATYPKVKRVYIAGDIKNWKVGTVRKRTGREVRGVSIEYEQGRAGYRRKEYTAERSTTSYEVAPASVSKTSQRFMQVVEVPEAAHNVQFHTDSSSMPDKYRHALQDVR
jgi:hypothetical protein